MNMVGYKKLSELITENSSELKEQLKGKKLPKDAESIQKLCVNYVGRLTSKDSYYMKQLSLLEQDLLMPVLKVMDTLYATDMDLSKKISGTMSPDMCKMSDSQFKEIGQGQNKSICKKYRKEYAPALIGATGGTIIGSLFKPNSWSIILLSSVISAIVGKVLYDLYVDKKNRDSISEVGKNKDLISEYRLTLVDVENIIKGLEAVGDCVDKVLLIYRKHIEILQNNYAKEKLNFSLDKKYIEVLECFQTILGNLESNEKTPMVKDSIKQIVNTLANQGYKVVHYSEQTRMYFKESTREGDVDVEEFKPAILRESDGEFNVVLRGNVLISNNNK